MYMIVHKQLPFNGNLNAYYIHKQLPFNKALQTFLGQSSLLLMKLCRDQSFFTTYTTLLSIVQMNICHCTNTLAVFH